MQLTLTYNFFLDGNKIYVGNKKQTQNTRLITLTCKIYLPLQTSEHKIRDEQKHCWYFLLRVVPSFLEYFWSELTIYIYENRWAKMSRNKSLLIRKVFIQSLKKKIVLRRLRRCLVKKEEKNYCYQKTWLLIWKKIVQSS